MLPMETSRKRFAPMVSNISKALGWPCVLVHLICRQLGSVCMQSIIPGACLCIFATGRPGPCLLCAEHDAKWEAAQEDQQRMEQAAAAGSSGRCCLPGRWWR